MQPVKKLFQRLRRVIGIPGHRCPITPALTSDEGMLGEVDPRTYGMPNIATLRLQPSKAERCALSTAKKEFVCCSAAAGGCYGCRKRAEISPPAFSGSAWFLLTTFFNVEGFCRLSVKTRIFR